MQKCDELSTIFIISKGRPQCQTARTLSRMEYPGDWFIVCGNNDETLPEYKKRWGNSRVLVFDWYDEITRTDTLDNFGFETMASGAVPARNATCDIARSMGCRRHWQFDDDYSGFYRTDLDRMKKHQMAGDEFMRELRKLAEFADSVGLVNCGFSISTIESTPQAAKTVGKRIFNAHNMPCDPNKFIRWRGRMNDDLINAIDCYRTSIGREYLFRYMSIVMKQSQQEKGGLTDLYKAEGTVRKTAYPVLVAPGATKLVIRFGRYHHEVDWSMLTCKLISEKWRKE